MRQGGREFCDELLTRNLQFNGLLLSMCFTDGKTNAKNIEMGNGRGSKVEPKKGRFI